jgi:phosphoglycolate phosphatase-like HAD superfamily hydrolase
MKPKNKKLIVFDMDGVIIDVSGSYRDTVRQTTKLFFKPAQAAELLPDPLFDLSDLAGVKQRGGLNNDWDLTYVVINLLFTLVNQNRLSENNDSWDRYRKTLRLCDVTPMVEFLASADRPLTTLLETKGKPEDRFISGLYVGDVGSGNIIKQIFQEIYLGEELFESTYDLTPEVCRGKGYILREKLLIDRSILEDLSKDHILAIATGRPGAEALYPLEHFGMKKYFSAIYTLDDCIAEETRILQEEGKTVSLSKPHPFMLDAIAETIDEPVDGYYYVGDMPDDMLAAARSRFGFKGIGILVSSPEKEALKKELERARASSIVDNFVDFCKIIDFSIS